MNPEIAWPTGAQPFAHLQQVHDKELLYSAEGVCNIDVVASEVSSLQAQTLQASLIQQVCRFSPCFTAHLCLLVLVKERKTYIL